MSAHKETPPTGQGQGTRDNDAGDLGRAEHVQRTEVGADAQARLRVLVARARELGEADGMRLRRRAFEPVVRAYGRAFERHALAEPLNLPEELLHEVEALLPELVRRGGAS